MFAIVARMKVAEGKDEEFVAVMTELAGEVRKNEPGCTLYQLCKSQGEPGLYVMLERYASQQALADHSKTAHFRAAMPKLGPLLDGAAQIDILQEVS